MWQQWLEVNHYFSSKKINLVVYKQKLSIKTQCKGWKLEQTQLLYIIKFICGSESLDNKRHKKKKKKSINSSFRDESGERKGRTLHVYYDERNLKIHVYM